MEAADKDKPMAVVTVASALSLPVALDDIKPGSADRKEFEEGFITSMSEALSNFKVVIDSITAGSRRLLNTDQASQHRQLNSKSVKVDFHTIAPKSVATQAASLVTTLASSGTSINVTVGNKVISAPTSAIAAPKVTQAPDVDCEGKFSACLSSCEKIFIHSKAQSGTGKACLSAHSAAESCTGGSCESKPVERNSTDTDQSDPKVKLGAGVRAGSQQGTLVLSTLLVAGFGYVL